jgi:hypothetical protein
MKETFDELKALFEACEPDAEKFFNNSNKAAGKRLRKNVMEIKKLCTPLRQEISEEIASL